jgi:hypothetical protein
MGPLGVPGRPFRLQCRAAAPAGAVLCGAVKPTEGWPPVLVDVVAPTWPYLPWPWLLVDDLLPPGTWLTWPWPLLLVDVHEPMPRYLVDVLVARPT